nr:helix-turn-helix domain-containing protein [uncultured Pseudomonas sp.]
MSKARNESNIAKTVDVFLHPDDLMRALGVSRNTLDNWVAAGHFPAPVQLGITRSTGRHGRVAWLKSEVDAWILARAAAPRPSQPLAAFSSAHESA